MRSRKPKALQTPGIADTWKEISRRRCRNCNEFYQPVRPDQKFCKTQCRSDFNHHGGAYLKLRDRFIREMRRLMEPVIARVEEMENRIVELERKRQRY